MILALTSLDDISLEFSNWEKGEVIDLQKQLTKRLFNAGLPIGAKKSLELGKVEEDTM